MDRTKELEYKLDRAKCVSKFVTPVETKSIIESGGKKESHSIRPFFIRFIRLSLRNKQNDHNNAKSDLYLTYS